MTEIHMPADVSTASYSGAPPLTVERQHARCTTAVRAAASR